MSVAVKQERKEAEEDAFLQLCQKYISWELCFEKEDNKKENISDEVNCISILATKQEADEKDKHVQLKNACPEKDPYELYQTKMKHNIEEDNFEETNNLANVDPFILELEEIEPHNEVAPIVKEKKPKRKIVRLELGGNHFIMNDDLTSKLQLCEPQMDAIQIKNFGI